MPQTGRFGYGFSTGSTLGASCKFMDANEIKIEENGPETDYSFDCNIAEGA
jgi:hypothetical protein